MQSEHVLEKNQLSGAAASFPSNLKDPRVDDKSKEP
jgi:hypothetical protein